MSALVVALLVAPALAAAAAALLPHRAKAIGVTAAAAVGAGWVAVALTGDVVEAGDLVVDPLLAAAGVGLAVLVVAGRTATLAGTAAPLLAMTVLLATAALDEPRLPDRRFGAGIVIAAVLAAVQLLARRGRSGGPLAGPLVLVVAGVLLGAGLSGDDPGEALALAAAGTVGAAVATLRWGGPGRLVLVAGLVAVARVGAVRPPDGDTDVALLAVAALVAAGAAALLVLRSRPIAERLPVAAALAAVGLLASDVAELRSAGALLAGGAVLALAARHPAGLLALAPGLAAAVHVAGLATEPEHAAIGAAGLAALAFGATGPVRIPRLPSADAALTTAAVAFAVLPSWGWSGAETGAYLTAVAVAAAVAAPVLLLGALATAGVLPAGPGAITGTLVRRPRADHSHGSALIVDPAAEATLQEEAGIRAP